MDLRSGSRETLRSFLFSPWTKLHTVKRLIFGVDQRTSWIYTLNPTTRTQSKESFQLEKSKEQGTNGHRNRPAVPWRFTLLWLPSAETWAAPSSQVWIWFKRPSHNCPWAWSHMLGPFRKPTELGSSHLTGRSCEVPCQGQTGEAVSCTVRMFRERFTVHNSTPLVGAWGSSLVQMRGSQCFPGKKGAKEIWQQTDRNRSKFYSKNSTEVLRQQDSTRKGSVHLAHNGACPLWVDEWGWGGRMEWQPSFKDHSSARADWK